MMRQSNDSIYERTRSSQLLFDYRRPMIVTNSKVFKTFRTFGGFMGIRISNGLEVAGVVGLPLSPEAVHSSSQTREPIDVENSSSLTFATRLGHSDFKTRAFVLERSEWW
jgi:hypothetical protein